MQIIDLILCQPPPTYVVVFPKSFSLMPFIIVFFATGNMIRLLMFGKKSNTISAMNMVKTLNLGRFKSTSITPPSTTPTVR